MRISRGETAHPALAVQRAQNQLRDLPPAAEAALGDFRDGPRNELRMEAGHGGDLYAAGGEAGADDEAAELARLLLRAEQAWAEYQRLKSTRER